MLKTNLQSVCYIVCFCGSGDFTIVDWTGCSLISIGFDLICVYCDGENHFLIELPQNINQRHQRLQLAPF